MATPINYQIDASNPKITWADNGAGGVNYFWSNNPITREQYQQARPNENVGAIERSVAQNYAARNAGATNTGGGSATGGSAGPSAADLAFLTDQADQIRSLLGRTQTNLDQGLAQNENNYKEQVGNSTQQKDSQVVDQNKAKLSAYDIINRNAGQGYKSLAQIIGRSAGTGSSAYRDALPDVVGKDTSSKRFNATGTYDTNLSKIDASFQNVLADLLKQKKKNEESVRSGVEQQRQALNQQLAQNAGQYAQATGGGYEQVKAAQQPYQQAIENSRNQVENFFNQFKTDYTPQAVAAEVNPYNTDRAAINAGQQGIDASNPYAAMLRKKQQGIQQ